MHTDGPRLGGERPREISPGPGEWSAREIIAVVTGVFVVGVGVFVGFVIAFVSGLIFLPETGLIGGLVFLAFLGGLGGWGAAHFLGFERRTGFVVGLLGGSLVLLLQRDLITFQYNPSRSGADLFWMMVLKAVVFVAAAAMGGILGALTRERRG